MDLKLCHRFRSIDSLSNSILLRCLVVWYRTISTFDNFHLIIYFFSKHPSYLSDNYYSINYCSQIYPMLFAAI